MNPNDIPTLQEAVLIEDPGLDARVVVREDVPVGAPGLYEVLVQLSFTGVCGSEVRALRGWGSYDPIVGHEGIGSVVKLGGHVPESLLGRKVGVKWLYRACGECSVCVRGFSNNCPKQLNTGKQRPGTLQQYVVADSRYLTPIPRGISDEEAAPLLCAGLTMMGAVSMLDNDLSRRDWVVIQGAGGGLGHLGVQIASRMRGLRVIAVDTGHEKRTFTETLGAEAYIDYEADDVERAVIDLTGEGAHAVIVVPGSEDAYKIAPKLVRSMGTVVCVGLPHNDFQLPISITKCAIKALTIKGAMVGTEEQMSELLQAASKGIVRAIVEPFKFSDVPDILDRLAREQILGRAVVRCL
ncbi:Putative alcohol dehydrogenase, zinc-type, GroES-like superfamily, NAD(P)-binding domain superfamily [Colletotrichum destructivum]|uniref:Alcohol dehydrogenase, zinc-type, GroES-like superfamily, NAD(P)-binding domain superfamily n=1 Tax=Colletotrichum destructivum TaxID=34406 RepID=A0AAX4J1S5_9PEZI|nr:Putative alcohol dehydrogenase, zinc-type, GroES-like superfamily, NAD(P)-binding domain superfamily [Colletotrichum destructivum]